MYMPKMRAGGSSLCSMWLPLEGGANRVCVDGTRAPPEKHWVLWSKPGVPM